MKRLLYSGVVLDKVSHDKLVNAFERFKPEGWKTYAHHMTIAFGEALSNSEDEDKVVKLTVTSLGISDKAIAVSVEGYPSKNKIPHVTLFVEPLIGKPVDSNYITDWNPCDKITLYGVLKNITT